MAAFDQNPAVFRNCPSWKYLNEIRILRDRFTELKTRVIAEERNLAENIWNQGALRSMSAEWANIRDMESTREAHVVLHQACRNSEMNLRMEYTKIELLERMIERLIVSIIQEQKIVLINEADLTLADTLLEEYNFFVEYHVAPTAEGEDVADTLINLGTPFDIADAP